MSKVPVPEQLHAVDPLQQLRHVHGKMPLVIGDAPDPRLPDEAQPL